MELTVKIGPKADVFEYKNKWRSTGETVNVRGNLDKCKKWCKTNLFMGIGIIKNTQDQMIVTNFILKIQMKQ